MKTQQAGQGGANVRSPLRGANFFFFKWKTEQIMLSGKDENVGFFVSLGQIPERGVSSGGL